MEAMKVIWTGGKIVLPDRIVDASLVMENGIISGMIKGELDSSYKVVDVSGKILMPGVIDSHVHMWDPSPMNYREDWYHGSRAAASGGITTILDMPLSIPPVTDESGLILKKEIAKRDSFVDFAFWGGLIPSSINNLNKLNDMGCVAYKGFMSFANSDYPQITDGYLIQGMKEAAKFNGLIGVHAENAEAAEFVCKEMYEQKVADEAMYDEARPWWVELEAIQRAILFARATGCRLYICHMTIPEGAEMIKKAKSDGIPVVVETCPHYLIFDHTILREKKSYGKCNPPLRSRERVDKLWEYLLDGVIDVIGSDHGPYSDEEKIREGNFWKEYSGFGGFDVMLSALITEGVHKRGLSLPHLSMITAGNTAKIMGLNPQKGSLLPGSDADVLVVDINAEWKYDGTKSFSKTRSDKGIYQNIQLKGKVEKTYVRGKLIYDQGEIIGKAGYGTYIPKQKA